MRNDQHEEDAEDREDDEGPSVDDIREFGDDGGTDERTCPNCGGEVYELADFCPHCRHAIALPRRCSCARGDDAHATPLATWVVVTAIVLAIAFLLWSLVW